MFDDYNEFDIALALYHWLQNNWNGQDDPKYEAFCTLTAPGMFRCSPSEEFFENIDEIAQLIYSELTNKNYKKALARVLNYKSEGL